MTPSKSPKPVAIVTGASAGIGEAVARRLAKGGFRIVAVARRQNRLDDLARSLSGVTEVATVAVDVTAKDAAERAVETAMKTFGRLDCLVNNAGNFTAASIVDTDDAMLDAEIDVSLKAVFRFSRAALRVMSSGSSIISVGSVWGLAGGMQGAIYCAVKAGLIGLTQSIAVDFGAKGIRANVVAPGVVKTDMTRGFWDTAGFQRTNQEMTPFNRDGTVEDVANAVHFLASEEGSFINGQTIALDGGWSTTRFLSLEALLAERVKPGAST